MPINQNATVGPAGSQSIQQPQVQPQAQPTQPQDQNPVIGALKVLQAFILAQKEKGDPKADSLMKIYSELISILQNTAQPNAQTVQLRPSR